jgi:hypothetical protein
MSETITAVMVVAAADTSEIMDVEDAAEEVMTTTII